MNKKDLLSKLAQVYDEKYQEEKPILFPSDIPRQERLVNNFVSGLKTFY